jgi:iron complex outermembrane receptor protein
MNTQEEVVMNFYKPVWLAEFNYFASIKKKCFFLILLPLLFMLHPALCFSAEDLPTPASAEDKLDEELKYLKAETYVITASRIPEDIKKTASSITVITDKQIRQMGARDLSDVLQKVPGFGYYYHYTGSHVIYARGMPDEGSTRLLMMINSHPINENYTGGATWTHDTLSLDNVKRIEVIRGPGSALYGANAFAGVVNIITKEGADINGCELTARGGSYDTQQYNLLYGKTFNDLDIALNFNYTDTNGFHGHVDEDLQTNFDHLFFTDASLAPGHLKGYDEKYDAQLTLQYKGLKFDGRYVDRDRDFPVGWLPILNHKTNSSIVDYYLNLSYEKTLWEGFDLLGKVYRDHNRYRIHAQFFPPGAAQLTPLFMPVIMPEGRLGYVSIKNSRTGCELQATYKLSAGNTMVAGVTYEEMKQYDTRTHENFLFTFSPYFIIPLPRVIDVTSIQDVNQRVTRNFKAFFIEDIWDMTRDIRLTAGARYDDYSDFGNSFNPRIGLTWEFRKGYDLKLLYGSAFRAPSFSELYDIVRGDPDLEPEKVTTYQVSLGAEVTSALSSRVTWFQNWIKDAIVPKMWSGGFEFLRLKNQRKMRTEGLEVEMKYDFGRGSYLSFNYTNLLFIKRDYQWFVPKHTGNIMLNVRLSRYLNYQTDCHFEDGFKRQEGDKRADKPGYGIVNTTLIAKQFLKGYEGLELRASVYNLFDKDYSSPTGNNELPDDLPRPGRNFIIEVKYKF